jgi:hypothetical protein
MSPAKWMKLTEMPLLYFDKKYSTWSHTHTQRVSFNSFICRAMLFSDKVCFLAINDKSRKVMNSSITTALLQCYLDSDNESEDINEEKVAQTEL